ncbi:nitrous oxide reductase accessory protein NosL [Neisseria sp. ZJ104]|uniref:Nitrous oxide reductase accessory protein NosL n=1 Tax=Neisseria lisongii TaxID=2912188 RepID=A0AAW5AFH7_9NEIS|nr:nitrous oxide reductase accessory protein NosL [Neisseria lisongii]MCF7530446.1 nitrous oxide reductase accessory protein NosL [Neisseria lisongii]
MIKHTICACGLAATLAACGSKTETAPPPAPQSISSESIGHYCTMNLAEHIGPKAQIFLNGKPDKPVWFSTIKQMFGYTKLPEEPKGIAVIYVTDMGQVGDWNKPNADGAWIDAKKAYYVIESGFIGGMGAEDALPFADKAKAEQFAQEKGGRVVGFDDMPEAYIFQ